MKRNINIDLNDNTLGIKVNATSEKFTQTQTLQEFVSKIENTDSNVMIEVLDAFSTTVPFECQFATINEVKTFCAYFDSETYKIDYTMVELIMLINILTYCSNITINKVDFMTPPDENNISVYDVSKLMELYNLMFTLGGDDFVSAYGKLYYQIDKVLQRTLTQETAINNSIETVINNVLSKLIDKIPTEGAIADEAKKVMGLMDGKGSVIDKVLKYVGAENENKITTIDSAKALEAIDNIGDMIDNSNVGKTKKKTLKKK